MTTTSTPRAVRTHHAERGGRVSVPGSGIPLGEQIGRGASRRRSASWLRSTCGARR